MAVAVGQIFCIKHVQVRLSKNTDVTKQEASEGSAVASAVGLRGPLDGLHDPSKDDFANQG